LDGNYYNSQGIFEYLCFQDGNCINAENQVFTADSLGIVIPSRVSTVIPPTPPSNPVQPIQPTQPIVPPTSGGSAPQSSCTLSAQIGPSAPNPLYDATITWSTTGITSQGTLYGGNHTAEIFGYLPAPSGVKNEVNQDGPFKAVFYDTSGNEVDCSASIQ